MKPKSHSDLRARVQKILWMVLVLLLIGSIWRGLSTWLANIESGYVPGRTVDNFIHMRTIAAYVMENWQSELFPFAGQVIGLACLLHIGPLQNVPIKDLPSSDAGSSAVIRDEMAGSGDVIS